MDAALLDTGMLKEVLKQKNESVVLHATDFLKQHGRFAIFSMTRRNNYVEITTLARSLPKCEGAERQTIVF